VTYSKGDTLALDELQATRLGNARIVAPPGGVQAVKARVERLEVRRVRLPVLGSPYLAPACSWCSTGEGAGRVDVQATESLFHSQLRPTLN
jgi:hypothetical protein